VCEPVGVYEIAERLGVRQQTVAQWVYRSRRDRMTPPMPQPRWLVSKLPAWDWPEVAAWAKATGRERKTKD
jgi:hypothetical protein